MALKVAEVPPLPKVASFESPTVGLLIRALFQHFLLVGRRLNMSLPEDGTEAMTGPLRLKSYTVLGVPSAADNIYGLIYVSNETGGAVPAFSDGTNWRRVTDRNVVS